MAGCFYQQFAFFFFFGVPQIQIIYFSVGRSDLFVKNEKRQPYNSREIRSKSHSDLWKNYLHAF